MTTNPTALITVVMPCFNMAKYVGEAIESIQRQTNQNWEIIVVDDNSTDGSADVVQSYASKDSRIRLIRNEQNMGAGMSRNIAMKAAQGRFITFLDADDIDYPTKLETQMNYMLQNDVGFTFGSYDFLNEEGTKIGSFSSNDDKVDYDSLLTNCVIACHTVMLDRQKLTGQPQFVSIKRRQDFVFWLELLKHHFDFAYRLPNPPLVGYRLRKNSLSSNKIGALLSNYHVYRHFERFSVVKSLWILLVYCLIYVRHRMWIRIKTKLKMA